MLEKSLAIDIDALTEVPDQLDIDIVREHCHVDPEMVSDDVLTTYILAAIAWFEGETKRTVFARPHRWTLAEFPYADRGQIDLPQGKTQSVESIAYSSGHTVTTLTGPSLSPPGSDFQQALGGNDGGVVMPAAGGSWPSVDSDVPSPVVVTFRAGWEDGLVPADIIQQLLFYVSDANEVRGTADVDQGTFADIRESRISGYRLHRW